MAYGSTTPAQESRSAMRGAVAAASTVLALVGAVALFQSYSEMPTVSGKITQNADLDTTAALAETTTAKMSNSVAVDADPGTIVGQPDVDKGIRDRVRDRVRAAFARPPPPPYRAPPPPPPKVDCAGVFSPWTDCTKGCGGGTKERTFTVTTQPKYGGTPCDAVPGCLLSRSATGSLVRHPCRALPGLKLLQRAPCNTGPCAHTGLKRAVWENLNDKADDWRNKYDRLVHVLPGAVAEGTAPTKPDISPSSECGLTKSFEAPVDTVHDGGQLIAGVFVPPTSGSYEFSLAADDGGELYFGETAASKTKIASISSFLGAPGKYNGESTQASTQIYFSEAKRESGAVSAPMNLTAGTKYYISAMEINRQGRDALSVAAKGGPFSSEKPIPSTHDGETVLSYEAESSTGRGDSALAACSIEEDPTPAIATTFEYPKSATTTNM